MSSAIDLIQPLDRVRNGVSATKYTVQMFVNDWQKEFTQRIRTESRSTKQLFKYKDALKLSEDRRTDLDELMIAYVEFIGSNPLKDNDYFKFVNAYIQHGKRLDEKYFRHDLTKLHDYYKKYDNNKSKGMDYNPFNESEYNKYVLFMMMKLKGLYQPEYDKMFNVKTVGSREYNPITSIPSVLRQYLPFRIKEYDIAQAYPSFIFLELDIEPFDVYSIIDKSEFNTLLNMHHEVKNAKIENVRANLRPIYGDRVNEVITEDRFNNKGRTFEDLAKYEAEYIQKFVDANNLKNYVRLHDGVVVLEDDQCDVLDFGVVKFAKKDFAKSKIVNNVISFYTLNPNGEVITTPVSYYKFFEQEKFIRITREGHDEITILKNDNKILTPINHKTDLVPYLKANINEVYSEAVENRIARDANNIIQQSLQLLTPKPLKYHRDTKTTVDLPFKNGIVRITADSMELVPYDEIDGFFPKHSTQQHEISFDDVNEEDSDFARFLAMACTGKGEQEELTKEDKNIIKAFFTMFGYLLTNYKDPAFSPAIILSDEGADGENRNGGRGKSLVQRALSYFRPTIEKGGNAYDPNYTHVHADLKLEHDIYIIDDVPMNFNYNALYTHITGSIDAQRKGVTAETIPFEYAPKFVISTNWAVRYDENAASTNRRFIEYKFSNFWNIENTPVQYFGKSFFADWNDEEWNRFFNFGFFCIQKYLKHGLKTIKYDKREDNFRAYFYNDAILEEMERLFGLLNGRDFTVTDFLNEHKTNPLYHYKSEFNVRNAKKYIDAFIEFRELPYSYDNKWRKWVCNGLSVTRDT